VAEEVALRLERTATLAAAAILESIYRPQVVSPTSDAALDYWERILLPGGQFDPAGRDRVVAQVGAPEYREIAQSLARRMRREAEAAPEPPPLAVPAPVPLEEVA